MIDRTEAVKTADGTMEVFVTRPEGSGPFPVVIQIMDGLGMREELRDHARRTASWGYYVLAPDLFYRRGLKGPLATDDDGMKLIRAAVQELTDARAKSDVDHALALAASDKAARPGKFGVYGFCMGGRLTLVLAQAFGDRVAAGASIHAGALVVDSPESPHRHLDRVTGELYFGVADKDAMATPEQIDELEKALKTRKINYQLEWHPGALHGFMMPGRTALYHRDAAETVWSRMETLFARRLK
jgi:carboxymethylenebutenolidase